MKIDFARLNHILIPNGKEGRDRFRESRFGRIFLPLVGVFWGSLTDEGRTLVFVTLLVGAFAIDVQRSVAYVLFSVLAGLLAAALVVARGVRLHDVAVSVAAPRRVTVGEPVTFTITCKHGATSEDGRARHPIRVRGPFLPWDGAWLDEAPPEIVVPGAGSAQTTMRARFVHRGLHHLDPFTAAAVAPAGLSSGPRLSSEAVKLHVVPRIPTVLKLPSALASRPHQGGATLASRSGEAMDLLGVKPYRPGDPVRDLHARSWARTGIPVVREYQQEYFARVGVVLDNAIADPDRLEAAVELVAGIIAFLSRGEALVDVLVVGDRVHELAIGRGAGSLDQALDLLAIAERGPSVDAASLVRRLGPHLERLSSMVIVADEDSNVQAGLHDAITARGVACSTIVIDDALVKSIAAKEALGW